MTIETALRRTTGVILSAGVMLALAACGGVADDSTASGDEPGDGEEAAETRMVESPVTGDDVEVPIEPERVVALWRSGSVLADLGVVPVGALDGEMLETELPPEVYETVSDVPVVGTWEGVDIEALIAAEPDLIIGMDHGGLDLDYEEVSQVAPTVILDIAEPPDVWANYPTVADLVGLSTDYEERNAAVEDELAAIAEEFGDTIGDLEVSAISESPDSAGTMWVSTSKSLNFERIDAAGFGYNPDYTEDPERYLTELSAENVADLSDQDAIFYDVNLDGSIPPNMQAILDSESFQRLPAAEAGHVFPLTSGVIYTFDAADQQVAELRAAAEELSS